MTSDTSNTESVVYAGCEIPGRASGSRPLAKQSLIANYRFQKAYYDCDKRFFAPAVRDIAQRLGTLPLDGGQAAAISRLIQMAAEAASGEEVELPSSSRCSEPSSTIPASAVRLESLPSGRYVVPSARLLDEEMALELDLEDLEDPCVSCAEADETRTLAAAGGNTNCTSAVNVIRNGRASNVQPAGNPVALGIIAPLEDGPHRFGIETDRFKELIKIAAKQGVLAYVFFPAGDQCLASERNGRTIPASYGHDTIEGWFYRERRGWFRAPAPLPDVVYDRHVQAKYVHQNNRMGVRSFSQAHPEIQLVNSLEFAEACKDKLATHEILSRDPSIRPYLPETIAADDPKAVVRFAAARETTYLKLRSGSGSRGISVIENLGAGMFRVSSRENYGSARNGVVTNDPTGSMASDATYGCRASSSTSDVASGDSALLGVDGLRKVIASTIGAAGGPGSYIAQDGIDLAQLPELAGPKPALHSDKTPIDLVRALEPGEVFEVRVICQKGGAGVWLRTGMVCRVNPTRGRFMVPREELHLRVDDLLGQIFSRDRVIEIKEEIRELGRRVPSAIEAASGPGGEISVDVGIDVAGRPWLIEVNSKPATLFRDIGAFGLRRLSLLRVVNYAARLRGGTRIG